MRLGKNVALKLITPPMDPPKGLLIILVIVLPICLLIDIAMVGVVYF